MGVIRRDVYVLRDALKNPIACVQGSDAVPIIFTVRDYDIPEGAKVRVYVQKPSTKAIFNDISGSVSGNEITVNVAPQMVAEQGISQIQLEISNDAKTLITFTYPLDVKRRLIPMDSENGSDFLDEYIEIMEESTSKANMAAENANDAASRAESIAGDLNAKLENGDFQGAKGEAATISIGTVTSSAPGAHAEVSNSGDSSQAVFNFVIPRGEQGPKGDPGSVDNLEQQSLNYTEPSDPGEGEESIPVPGSTLGVIAGWLMKKVKGIITTISDLSNSVDVLGNNLSEVKYGFGVLSNTDHGTIRGSVSMQKLSADKCNIFIKAKVVENNSSNKSAFVFDSGKILSLIGVKKVNFHNYQTVVNIDQSHLSSGKITEPLKGFGYGFYVTQNKFTVGRVYKEDGAFGSYDNSSPYYTPGTIYDISIFGATYS